MSLNEVGERELRKDSAYFSFNQNRELIKCEPELVSVRELICYGLDRYERSCPWCADLHVIHSWSYSTCVSAFLTTLTLCCRAVLETRAVAAIRWDSRICEFTSCLVKFEDLRTRWLTCHLLLVVSRSHAVRRLCPVYVHAVQLHACRGGDDQRHGSQPLSAHRRPLQPLLRHLPLPLHGEWH